MKKEDEGDRLACAAEEEETEWNKVRYFNQIQVKINPALTCPFLDAPVLPALISSILVPVFPQPP